MELNVNRTMKLQYKLDTIKNCTYLQCRDTASLRAKEIPNITGREQEM